MPLLMSLGDMSLYPAIVLCDHPSYATVFLSHVLSLYGWCHCICAGHYEYLPFYVPFKMIMGIQPLDPDEWIQMDPFYAEEMSMKRHLIDTRKDIVLQSLPEAEEANKELLELLLEYLPRRYPDV